MQQTHPALVQKLQVAVGFVQFVVYQYFLQGNAFVALQIARFQHLQTRLVYRWKQGIIHWCHQQRFLLGVINYVCLGRFAKHSGGQRGGHPEVAVAEFYVAHVGERVRG